MANPLPLYVHVRRLIRAVHQGSVAGVSQALAAGAPVNTLTADRSETVLGRALSRNHAEVVACLLDHGAAVGWPPADQPQPISPAWRSAFSRLDAPLLWMLLERHPGLLVMPPRGHTPHAGDSWDHPWAAAATTQAWGTLLALADRHRDAEHDRPPQFLRSFMALACSKAPLEVLERLQPIVRWNAGHHTTFGTQSAHNGRNDVFGWAWTRAADRASLMEQAIVHGRTSLLTPEALADPAVSLVLPDLALMAVAAGHGGVLRAILGAWRAEGRTFAQMAGIAQNTWGQPLLHQALHGTFSSALGDRVDWFEALLQAGGDVRECNPTGNTALHVLLEALARTPMPVSLLRTGRRLARRLVEQGNPLDLPNEAGVTAMDLLSTHLPDLAAGVVAQRMRTQIGAPLGGKLRKRL